MPEISHRCPACGVSLRDVGENVLFCPECGKPLATSAAEQGKDGEVEAPKAAPPVSTVMTDGDQPLSDSSAKNKADGPVDEERLSARERTRETLHRASQRTRGAIEDNVKRVEKIHHASSVMLEEATYDPSLRFVLVALGLFLLFVVLLILSKVMG